MKGGEKLCVDSRDVALQAGYAASFLAGGVLSVLGQRWADLSELGSGCDMQETVSERRDGVRMRAMHGLPD